MEVKVADGKTLLVDGPASVTLVSGEAEIFGYTLRNLEKVVIRDGKRMPFFVKKQAIFNVSLGENANIEEVDGNTIPSSWDEAYKELSAIKAKPATVLVLGAVDSGKTSFCTYLVNRLLNEKQKVAIVDGDLGQSDIGPPCTLAYAIVSRHVTDLFNLEARNAYFVGVTSPSKAVDKVIYGLTLMNAEIQGSHPDFIIVNSDGWVEGKDAVSYKVQLIEKINPSILYCIQQDEKLKPLLEVIKSFRTVTVDSPSTIKQRSRDKRRSLRELGYLKYLKNSKVQSIPASWLKIESDEIFIIPSKNFGDKRREREICDLLGTKPLYMVELRDKICVVIGGDRWINPESIKRTKEILGKDIMVVFKGEEKGLLLALYNDEKRFLGIGILREIDYRRKVVKIFTPVSSGISMVILGKVKLDENLKEIMPPIIEDSGKPLHAV